MKKILRVVSVFIASALMGVLLLTGVALIPRDSIQKHMEDSANQLTARDDYYIHAVDGVDCSIWDDIADANLLNIAYNWDAEHPLESVMWSKMYYGENLSKKESLKKVVFEQADPNTQYLRYWHGSLLFVRPLLLLLNLKQIYVFHYFLLAVLFLWILVLLFQNGLKTEVAALIISMIAVNIWFVPMCLEYTWMFLVCFVTSIVAVKLTLSGKENPFFFLIVGIVAGFLDFLTTETITFLIPMMLILRIRKDGNLRLTVKAGILWLIGYGGMWALKWGVASIVLRQNVLPYLTDSFALHTSVTTNDTTSKYIIDALMKNLSCLFPAGYGTIAAAVGIGILGIVVLGSIATNKVSLRKDIEWQRVLLYVALGLVPYVRYVILHFHAWYHYFFTYRAQAATVMALCFAIAEVVQINRKPTHTEPMPIISK